MKINFTYGASNRYSWSLTEKAGNVVAVKGSTDEEVGALLTEFAGSIVKSYEEDRQILIPLKEAARRLNLCVPKVQEFARSHYKGFPAVLEGNKYLVNARMLPEWADRYIRDAIEGRN